MRTRAFFTMVIAACSYSFRNLYTANRNHPYYELSLVYKFNVAADKYRGRGAGDKQKARM